jgi:hypothetical protein
LVVLDLRGEGHAVASARLDGHWLILDNQRMAMVEDVNARTYRPRFVIDESGVKEYSDAPLRREASGGGVHCMSALTDSRPYQGAGNRRPT